jgi:predicted alpha/beta superfamily hydrolase
MDTGDTQEAAMSKVRDATPMTGLHAAEYFDMQSQEIGETYRIFVAKPTPMEPDKKYPVLYFLDGNGIFGAAVDIQRMMSFGTEVPPAYVVGIGYAVENGFMETTGKRYRDYTPTVGGELEASTKRLFDPTDMFKPGGGPAFLKFIRDTLKPAMQAAYSIDPDDATIGGVSLGGLFPTWILLNQPETFQRYIICSPSIWWENEAVWQWEENCAKVREDLNATVFVTAGGLETASLMKVQIEEKAQEAGPMQDTMAQLLPIYDKHGWPRMAEITPTLADKLKSRNYPGLKIHCHNLPDETHMSVPACAISRGLRYVFGHWNP